jgi:hypothetical protein
MGFATAIACGEEKGQKGLVRVRVEGYVSSNLQKKV